MAGDSLAHFLHVETISSANVLISGSTAEAGATDAVSELRRSTAHVMEAIEKRAFGTVAVVADQELSALADEITERLSASSQHQKCMLLT